jgi:adenylosuccinate synthase
MPKIITTVGLHFGDEGKGTIVDYLSRMFYPATVVRYSGGPQAAHNVITVDNKHHTFSQFGSGTFAGAGTVLQKDMIIDPAAFLKEREELKAKIAPPKIVVDLDCSIVTPYHKFVGQMEKIINNLSSCGMGVGYAIKEKNSSFNIAINDLLTPNILKLKLFDMKARLLELAYSLLNKKTEEVYHNFVKCEIEDVVRIYLEFILYVTTSHEYHIESLLLNKLFDNENLIFEGSQGILIDANNGFSPYITKSDVTTQSINKLLARPGFNYYDVIKIGILRPYAHRHGNGPLPTEGAHFPEEHNVYNKWQGKFRTGCFDMLLSKYAICKNPVDVIAMTNMDRVEERFDVCYSYIYDGPSNELGRSGDNCIWTMEGSKVIISNIINPCTEILNKCRPHRIHKASLRDLECDLNTPIKILSYGPTAADKRWRL